MRALQLFSLAVLYLVAVVLAQSSSSEAPYVYDALFVRSSFFGNDTSDPSAIDLDIFQHPKNHPTAIASILMSAAFAASFNPKDGVITDPEVFSKFEAEVSRVSALQLVEDPKIISLTGDYHQLACEISRKYDSPRAVTVATAFRGLIPRFVAAAFHGLIPRFVAAAFHGLIPRFVAKNPWRNLLLVVMFIDRDSVSENIIVEMVSIGVTITKNFGLSIISRQQVTLTQKIFHVDTDDLVFNAEKWKEIVNIYDVDYFLKQMSSTKDQGLPDYDDKPSTCNGIFKGIQDFFSSIGGIFENVKDLFVGIIGSLIPISVNIMNFFQRNFILFSRDIANFFSQIFKSKMGFITITPDLITRDFHAFATFFSETVVPLLICAWRLLPYVFGWSIVGVVSLPLVISGGIIALGFGPQGIIMYSIAALCMSYFHPIARNSTFAILQSLGTFGIFSGFNRYTVFIGIVSGGTYGFYLGYFVNAVCSAEETLLSI